MWHSTGYTYTLHLVYALQGFLLMRCWSVKGLLYTMRKWPIYMPWPVSTFPWTVSLSLRLPKHLPSFRGYGTCKGRGQFRTRLSASRPMSGQTRRIKDESIYSACTGHLQPGRWYPWGKPFRKQIKYIWPAALQWIKGKANKEWRLDWALMPKLSTGACLDARKCG